MKYCFDMWLALILSTQKNRIRWMLNISSWNLCSCDSLFLLNSWTRQWIFSLSFYVFSGWQKMLIYQIKRERYLFWYLDLAFSFILFWIFSSLTGEHFLTFTKCLSHYNQEWMSNKVLLYDFLKIFTFISMKIAYN